MDIWTEIARDRERGARRLVAEYGDRLLTAAFQMTQNRADAEDLAFRTFAQVVSKIDTYAGRSPFFTWVYRILLNFRRMDLRKKGANALVLTDELPEDADPTPDPAEALALRASAAEVRAAARSAYDEAADAYLTADGDDALRLAGAKILRPQRRYR